MSDETPFNSTFDADEEIFEEFDEETLREYVEKLKEHFSETSILVEPGGTTPFDPIAILKFPTQSGMHTVAIESPDDAELLLDSSPPVNVVFFDSLLGYYDVDKKEHFSQHE
jgi:hypothetical protein